MFTGLVQTVGKVAAMTPNSFGARLLIDARHWSHRPEHGDSIAVSGVCLTYAPAPGDTDGMLGFDVIAETLRKTKLGDLRAGGRVNLEPCLTPSSRLGGHFVQGHVDGLGAVTAVKSGQGEHRITTRPTPELMKYIVPTGSIAIDGVSLTLAAVDVKAGTFDVALIPTTLDLTTLGDLKAGDRVNLEADVLVKSVVNYLENYAGTDRPGVTLELLKRAGFAE